MELTSPGGLLLVDKSGFVSRPLPRGDELCTCAVTRLEVLSSARSQAEYREMEDELAALRNLRMDAETFAGAAVAQRELAGRGEHRIPVPDLLIAACAQQHGAGVLHIDRHYDTLATVLSFESVRLG